MASPSTENLGEGYNPTTCEETLSKKGFSPICPDPHCTEFQETEIYHANCGERGMYAPVQSSGCYNKVTKEWKFWQPKETLKRCNELNKQDESWELEECYCCCSCFANNTLIGLPDQLQVAISEIDRGDTVLAGKLLSGGSVEWVPEVVGFSQGTEDGIEPAMVFLVYGEDSRQMVTSPNQPLMLADGSLTTASRIVPGRDQLMGVDGTPLDVTLASLGSYTGGVHHIATTKPWTGSVDNHLIQANGVVAGDFVLQLHFGEVPRGQKVAGYSELPEIGTAQYAEVHSHVQSVGDSYSYAASYSGVEATSEGFTAYGPQQIDLPLGAQSLVTPRQAQDILEKGEQEPVTEGTGYTIAKEAIALVSGFYRDFVYYIDWNRSEPNVYAFEQYGQKVVLVCGGLARMQGVSFTGLTLAIAQSMARFIGGDPQTGYGYACTGEADLYAFGAISQKLWFGKPWLQQTLSAIKELTGLFELIDPDNAKGNPLNVCEEPSIECRFETWSSAISGGSLPACAGGPPPAPMKVQQVKVISATELQVTFSQSPVPAQAEESSAYELMPAGTVVSAKVNSKEGFIVVLEVSELEPGKYALSCSGLESTYGGKLEPNPTVADFEVPKPEGV